MADTNGRKEMNAEAAARTFKASSTSTVTIEAMQILSWLPRSNADGAMIRLVARGTDLHDNKDE
ncbi:hypothetical protein MMC32_001670, partial [Xylographa parallela]|nr:hypothetical protein [Xylographa parallela]